MAIEPTTQADPPEIISTVKARGGVTGNKVRYVLAISLLLVVARHGSCLSRRARRPDGRSHQRTREEL